MTVSGAPSSIGHWISAVCLGVISASVALVEIAAGSLSNGRGRVGGRRPDGREGPKWPGMGSLGTALVLLLQF